MLADQFLEAAEAAPHSRALDEIARLCWRAHAEGQLDEATAGTVSEAIAGRRRAFAAGQGFRRPSPQAPASGLPRAARSHPRSPDRQVSLERRRRQAASGVVPARIAASFTPGEIAVLSVIGRECQRRGSCTLPIDMLGALAGCSRTVVQGALRIARRLGVLIVKERRIPGRKSLTNVVTVAAKGWLAWLRLGGGGIGLGNSSATDNHCSSRGAKGLETDRLTMWQRKAIVAYERCASPPRRSRRL
jgi:hypothetical protein